MTQIQSVEALPEDLDLDLIGDHSTLPQTALEALREAALRRIRRDPVWFLENFWHVMNPQTFEWQKFKLRDYQHEDVQWILEALEPTRPRRIVGKARQVGLTTELTAMAMWDVLVNQNHPWLIASQTESDAKDTLSERCKTPYLMLPDWLREKLPKLLNDSVESMIFDNRSRILSVPSTSRTARSKVVFGVIMDEAAHADEADNMFSAIDPLCYGPLFVISTGNGMGNFFHQVWVDAGLSGSPWEKKFHPWHVVPGRDETWYAREQSKYRHRPWAFFQEYPATEDEMFAKTGMAVLPMDLLREYGDWRPPEYRIDLDMGWDEDNWRHWLDEDEQADNELWVWKLPEVLKDEEKGYVVQEPNYVVFCDVAEGLAHGDRTSIVVFDANNLEQVAAYRGWYPVEDLGDLLAKIGAWYHWALMIPERNNQGVVPINELHKYHGYPRMFRMPKLAEIQLSDRTPRFGWITTPQTKAKMVSDFIKAVRQDIIVLHDERFLEEAATFVKDGRGGFAASHNNYDDHVIGFLGAWQGVLEVGQYPIVWRPENEWRPVTFADLEDIEYANQDHYSDPLSVPINGRRSKRGTISWTF